MSRVTYANTPATAAQESLRQVHQVRLVSSAEEGQGVNKLPAGVYGFTYSPALYSAPLFATRLYRSYETHKLPDGEVLVVGFTTAASAEQLAAAGDEITLVIQPQPDEHAAALVAIPYSRMKQHGQYAAPNQHGLTVTLVPVS
jgi:hypothetical protein